MCAATNRVFARVCRKCRESQLPFADGGERECSVNIDKSQKQIDINRRFWFAPVSYGGFLWCFSETGELFVVSPFDNQALPFSLLGEGFGRSAFTISAPEPGDYSDNLPPYLLAASPFSIKGVNLLDGKIKEFLQSAPDELFISDFEDGYVGLESLERTIYFQKKRDGLSILGSYNLLKNVAEDYHLPEKKVVGPLKIGQHIGVYSKDKLYLLKDGELKAQLSFGSFQAWTSPAEFEKLQPRVGFMPYVVRGNSIYIPGIMGNDPGFLFVSFQGQTTNAALNFIRFTEDATYTEDVDSRLLVAKSGVIGYYDGTGFIPVRQDPQLNAQIPPFSCQSLTVGFTRNASGVETLRFYSIDSLRDYSLAKFHGLIGIGFTSCAGTLTFSYLRERDNQEYLGLIIWDVQ
ncbi:MAG TPA: hypothetical protein VF543_05770 [Pyrinomonadaceae bacterium]|jgi:hypothetical protein